MNNNTEKSFNSVENELVISDEVIAAIAINAAKDVEGVSGFSNRPTDIQGIFKDKEQKGAKVESSETGIKIHLYVILKSGANIPSVSQDIQNSVKSAVQSMTGKVVTRVNITVAGIGFIEPTEQQK